MRLRRIGGIRGEKTKENEWLLSSAVTLSYTVHNQTCSYINDGWISLTAQGGNNDFSYMVRLYNNRDWKVII